MRRSQKNKTLKKEDKEEEEVKVTEEETEKRYLIGRSLK